jgi:hypothetical protein
VLRATIWFILHKFSPPSYSLSWLQHSMSTPSSYSPGPSPLTPWAAVLSSTAGCVSAAGLVSAC